MFEELKLKLKALEQNVVSGGSQAANTEVREALKRKKKRAEQKSISRLREARERGEEDTVFEEITDIVMHEQDDELTAWGWWQTASAEGAGLVKVGPKGVRSEKTAYYSPLE